MPHILPVPTLDHVVVNARDRLDTAAETYSRLGFTLTPRGYHTLGSMNHLAMFGTDYLELIAVPPGAADRPEVMAAPVGLDGLVFASEDAAATYAALQEAGVPIDPPQQFSRPVEVDGRRADATFRTTRLRREAVPAGRLYFCQHLTRDLVWRDAWRHHANGAVGVARAVIAAQEPAPLAALFARMFGPETVRPMDDGFALIVGLARFDVVTPAALWEMFGDAAAESRGRPDYMAALSVRTVSLDAAERALEAGGIRGIDRIGTSVLVPASEAFGVTIEFTI
ncbi:MAG TPA: VOC family protein [Rhodopila sp.]|uniref:VOC family protein n=1 Tax=Rhodopila sp. TaxID=2480087 RepID=UPI002CD1A4A3|nr:VOC family protein [Rhodopila sp.]HVY15784.1 VOC family protein [Rhodopila sp.]